MASVILLCIKLALDIIISNICTITGRILPRLQAPNTDLTGKTAIVTGGNSGIGFEVARQLVRRGAHVYLACRTVAKAEKAASEIIDGVPDSHGRVNVLQLDTSSLASVKEFATTWLSLDRKIDIFVHNAGTPDAAGTDVTDEGLGNIYCTNFLGSFVLTYYLEDALAPQARVIFTSSIGQYSGSLNRLFALPGYRPGPCPTWGARPADSVFYGDTKMMQVVLAKMLQQRWERKDPSKGLIANAFSPGFTFTPIFAKVAGLSWYADPFYWFLRAVLFLATPVAEGAVTGVWLATTDNKTVLTGGQYFERCCQRTTFVDVEEAIVGNGRLLRAWQIWELDGGIKWD